MMTMDNHNTPVTDKSVDPAAAYLASLTNGSRRRRMAWGLATVAGIITGNHKRKNARFGEWHLLRAEDIKCLRDLLAGQFRSATVHEMLVAVKCTLKVAWRMGLISDDDYWRAAAVRIIPLISLDVSPPTEEAAVALLDVCAADPTPAGDRDAAIIGLHANGLSLNQLAELEVEDYHLDFLDLKEARIPVPDDIKPRLTVWVAFRGSESGPLFMENVPQKRIGRYIRYRAVLDRINERAWQAGLIRFL